MYAIIDIETTGGSAKHDKITEIAIYVHDGKQIVRELVSLINPEKSIPYYITQLTGITNEMVADAPRFYELAKQIVEITEDCVFVAHNASFDYGFIREEFRQLGYPFSRELFCTVKMSRKLIPGFKSYSLGNLCRDLDIHIDNRHRAAGDALATVKVFERLLSVQEAHDYLKLQSNGIPKNLHPELNPELFRKLPEEAGVYYFFNDKQDIIYIGKSNNIKQRVLSHFNGSKGRRAGQMRDETAGISFECTGSELAALLLESHEIKTHKPLYNRAQRRSLGRYGVYSFLDQNGYLNFRLMRTNGSGLPELSFTSQSEGMQYLEKQISRFQLCPKLGGTYESEGACFQHQIHQCLGACKGIEPPGSYNQRAREFLDSVRFHHENFLILDQGRNGEEYTIVKVEKGSYQGFGYLSAELAGNNELLHDCIRSFPDNRDVHMIIKRYLREHPGLRVVTY
jgi:DNA polymerase III subunit epsilon